MSFARLELAEADDIQDVEMEDDHCEHHDPLFCRQMAEDAEDGFFAFGIGEEGDKGVGDGGVGVDGLEDAEFVPETLVENLHVVGPFHVGGCVGFAAIVVGWRWFTPEVVFEFHKNGVDSFDVAEDTLAVAGAHVGLGDFTGS